MIRLVTAQTMRRQEQRLFESGKSPIDVMETAAKSIESFVKTSFGCDKKICAVCGKGNNGGDGLAAARLLFESGYSVKIIMAMGEAATPNAIENFKKAENLNIPITFDDYDFLTDCDVVIDAILGIGFCGGAHLEAIQKINSAQKYVVAVDVPTGINADTGAICGEAGKADAPVTFGYIKTGLMQYPGKAYCGKIISCDIGLLESDACDAFVSDGEYVKSRFETPKKHAHKGDFGHLLVIGGSLGMTGAATLACMGALRSGCGLVSLVIPENLNSIMEVKLTEAMTVAAPCRDKITFEAFDACVDLNKYSAAVIGPGLGQSGEVYNITKTLIARGLPLVIDADGINSLCANIDILKNAKAPIVLTPHPGEFGRLLNVSASEVQANRLGFSKDFSEKYGTSLILKGAMSIASSKGETPIINPTGNEGMATGGSGDVLSGITGAFLARGMSGFDAAVAGAYIHGLAGDFAAQSVGKPSLIASDIISFLPNAFKKIF